MVSSALLDGQCWHKGEFVLPFSAQTAGQMHALVKCSLTCHYSFVLIMPARLNSPHLTDQ